MIAAIWASNLMIDGDPKGSTGGEHI